MNINELKRLQANPHYKMNPSQLVELKTQELRQKDLVIPKVRRKKRAKRITNEDPNLLRDTLSTQDLRSEVQEVPDLPESDSQS